jgi:hypothetical protein
MTEMTKRLILLANFRWKSSVSFEAKIYAKNVHYLWKNAFYIYLFFNPASQIIFWTLCVGNCTMDTNTSFPLNRHPLSHLAWILITEVEECLTEMTSHLLIVLCVKVCASTSPKNRTSKWRLHCVTVCNSHHPHHHSACTFLTALDPKFTALKWELEYNENRHLELVILIIFNIATYLPERPMSFLHNFRI